MSDPAAGPGTWIFDCQGPRDQTDWLCAELAEIGFGAFEDTETGIRAFLPEDVASADVLLRADVLIGRSGFTVASRGLQPSENWNAAWEASIEPVEAGQFYIHPPWHPGREDRVSLCIEPKMSFGTAHHETTRLVLSILPLVVTPGATVLDAGSGTGILAIAARKLGAGQALAFDIDPWSVENTRENLQRNGVSGVQALHGGIEMAGPGPFGLILANINRNILLEMIPEFARRLEPGGAVVLSGILLRDEPVIRQAMALVGWDVIDVRSEGEWLAISAKA